MKNQNNDWLNQMRRERLQGSSRNPGTAALMSFFLMGMGQIYAGHIDRGIMLLGLHLSGLFAAISIYSGGIVYDAIFPILGAHLLIIVIYVTSVFFILLWIYNIKDAYYLALFSSFRDWFEVERVLLPMMQQQSGVLLSDKTEHTAGALPQPDLSQQSIAGSASDHLHEDADVVEVRSFSAAKDPLPGDEGDEGDEDDLAAAPSHGKISNADFSAVSMSEHSWKLYTGFAAILLLIGLWANRTLLSSKLAKVDSETHFAVSANIGQRAGALPANVAPAASLISDDTQHVVAGDQPALIVVPFVKGIELAGAGKFAEAAELFEADLAIAEPSVQQWKHILNAFFRADQKVSYENNLRRFLATVNNDASAWFSLGKLLYDRNELAEASQAIANGLKYDPDSMRGNYLLGSIYSDLKLYDDAIAFLQKVVSLEPLNLEFNLLLARALVSAGRSEDASRYFQRVLSISPEDKEARQALAAYKSGRAIPLSMPAGSESSILVVQGKKEARLIEKNTESDIPAAATGKVLYEAPGASVDEMAGNFLEPDSGVVQTATIMTPSEKEVAENKPTETKPEGKNLVKTETKPGIQPGSISATKASQKPVVAKMGANSGISEIEADLSDNREKSEQSATANEIPAGDSEFRDSIAQEGGVARVAENSVEALRKKGSFEFSKGNWEGALPFYLSILKQQKDPNTYEMVGLIFEKLAMPKDAFAAVEHAYQLGQRDSATMARLGRLAEAVGDRAKGEFYLYHALQKMPHRIDLRIRYANCLDANGKSQEALEELARVVAASADSYAVRRRAELEIEKIKARKK